MPSVIGPHYHVRCTRCTVDNTFNFPNSAFEFEKQENEYLYMTGNKQHQMYVMNCTNPCEPITTPQIHDIVLEVRS